ncbi:hypothetical protein Tco_0888997 [Tanacetum coccineum]
MEDDIGNPIPRREGFYYGYAAAELTDINDNDRVSIMNYIFDETNWADFMSDFVGEIENNREVGFIKVPVRHLADRIFSWVFRKLDVCLVGVEDGDGEVLYELGDGINRWLKDAQLTGYTGSYRDLLGEDELYLAFALWPFKECAPAEKCIDGTKCFSSGRERISFMMTRKAPEAAREGVEAATICEMKGLEK